MIERQLARVGVPGCIGLLYCVGWQWGTCPKSTREKIVSKNVVLTLRMDIVADLNIRISHLTFRLSGVMDDLNIHSLSDYISRISYRDFRL